MQILHPFVGSLQQYAAALIDPDRYRPARCPQCEARQPLTAHGFYQRTLVDAAFDGVIRVRRYLCRSCRRTVSLLPEFVLPYLRFSIAVIAGFLTARLGGGRTLAAAARAAGQPTMPYQRGQGWVRRFLRQAAALAVALGAWTPVVPAPTFALRALHMLTALGWIPAHRRLFAVLRVHLLGWPASLAPAGRPATLRPAPLAP
ncbi:MAG: transposase family protein [Gemmatimonadetes bacterium]|nr:transposase family protein [Gemmatimonadota bacterium]